MQKMSNDMPVETQVFLKQLGTYRGKINRATLLCLRGQALNGELAAAKKGLETALHRGAMPTHVV